MAKFISLTFSSKNKSSSGRGILGGLAGGSSLLSKKRTSSRRSVMTTLKSSSTYFPLVTLSVAVLALSMIQSANANLSCKTNSNCSIKGVGICKQHTNGEATCAGFYGAGNTYTDCFECPSGMTSLAGKAFYNTDCFLQCGDERCYVPEDGFAECSIESVTVRHVCLQTCNQDDYGVLNPTKPHATCVKESFLARNRTLTNQSYHNQVVITKAPKLKRYFKRSAGRRLKSDVDLHHQGPAAALLRNAGEDPLQLVSK